MKNAEAPLGRSEQLPEGLVLLKNGCAKRPQSLASMVKYSGVVDVRVPREHK